MSASSSGRELADLFHDLVRLETELWDLVDAELRRVHDLPLTWFEPLVVVSRVSGCRVADIAQALSITVGGTSKLIDRIAAAGLLVRTPHPEDGRSSVITLTDDSRHLVDAAGRTVCSKLERSLAPALSSPRLAQFTATVRRLRAAVADDRQREGS